MRYGITENSVLVGQLPTGGTVTIKLIDLATDNLITLTSNACVESLNIPGLYMWNTNSLAVDAIIGYSNVLYEMTDGIEKYYGKIVIGGYVDSNGTVDLTGIITDLTEVLDLLNIVNARI